MATSAPNLLGLALGVMAQRLEAAAAPPDLDLPGEGLCALLDAARRLPPREPWDLPCLDPDDCKTGLGQLLVQARRALAAQQQPGE